MPFISASSYRAPWYLPNAHGQTILPNLTRRRIRVNYKRERFELPDGDFMDLDWVANRHSGIPDRCAIALHGLEGDSSAPYVKGLVKSFDAAGYATGALNLRGCSGEPNRLKKFYHSGETESLRYILGELAPRFSEIFLIGFSLGGNIVLKLLGESPEKWNGLIRGAVGISVPCDLTAAADRLAEKRNAFYMKRFIRMLCVKLRDKEKRYPHYTFPSGCEKMSSFHQFDDVITAPLNGFKDAMDYWRQSSSLPFLGNIEIPTLLINARNDPFLAASCFPSSIAEASDFFYLETPDEGGHCGFPGIRSSEGYWHERRALAFFDSFGPG